MKLKNKSNKSTIFFYPFFIILLNVMPVFFLQDIPDKQLMPRLLLVNALLFGFYLLVILKPGKIKLDAFLLRQPLFIVFFGFALLTIISMLWATNPSEGIYDSVKTITMAILLLTLTHILLNTTGWQIKLTQIVIITALITSSLGLYEYVNKVLPDPDREIEGLSSVLYTVTGIMGHKNQLSLAVMLYLPFLFFGSFRLKSYWRFISIVTLCLSLLLIFLLETRSVWAAFILSTGSIMLYAAFQYRQLGISQKTSKGILFAILVLAAMGVGIFAVAFSNEGAINEKLETLTNPENQRNVHRINVWELSLMMAADKPLTGVGAGNWKVEAGAYHKDAGIKLRDSNWQRPHNDFLWVLTEKGIIGLLLFSSLFVLSIIMALKSIARVKDKEQKFFILMAAGGLIAYGITSLFTFPLERIHHQVFFVLFIAALAAQYFELSNFKKVSGNGKSWIFVVLLLTAFGVVYSIEMIRVEKHIFKAGKAMDVADWETVLHESQEAGSVFRNLDHENIPIKWYAGMAAFKLNRFDEALDYYSAASVEAPNNVIVLSNLAQVLIYHKKYEEAVAILEEVVDRYPDFLEARVNLVTAYYNLNEFIKAYKTIRKVKFRDRTPAIVNNIKTLKELAEKEREEKKALREEKKALREEKTRNKN